MSGIEPHWAALPVFCLVWGACCLAFLTLAGMMPLRARPEATRGLGGSVLVLGNMVLMAALAFGAVVFAVAQLRWTSIVVIGGLICLFAPAFFDLWPKRWRDNRAGLVLLAALQLAGIALVAPAMT